MIAEVIIDLPSSVSKCTYDYEIPDNLTSSVETGSIVIVPFSGQKKMGVVSAIKSSSKHNRLLEISDVAGIEIVSGEMMSLCKWVADRYFANLYRVLKLALPPGGLPRIAKRWAVDDRSRFRDFMESREVASDSVPDSLSESFAISMGIAGDLPGLERKGIISKRFDMLPPRVKEKIIRYYSLAVGDEEALRGLRKGARKQEVVVRELAAAPGPLPAPHLHAISSTQTVQTLIKKGIIASIGMGQSRVPREHSVHASADPKPNEEQKRAIETIGEKLQLNATSKILIQGVTASGKTKIYIEAVAKTLKRGRNSIVIVPEISLTGQMLSQFKTRFGKEVALIHSGLGSGERFDEWKRVRDGCGVVIGTRSAIFSPVSSLGLIIIDEEHDSSYKQDIDPKYHLHRVAEEKAKMNDALLILGSATPLLETRYEADAGKSTLIPIHRRIDKRPLPVMNVIDMRKRDSSELIFSTDLLTEMKKTLSKGEKILIFLNRRGFARFVLCPSCGWVSRCDNCNVSLIYHKGERKLRCHQCGFTEEETVFCPRCEGETKIFGLGIQQVEEELEKLFPEIPIIRMDTDSTKMRGKHLDLLNEFRSHQVAILLGTQMISKGHDFPDIGLVGIINADSSLNLPDFRAGERTFQQLVQVSGRAGRGEKPGKVIVQTFNPESDPVVSAKRDYDEFYSRELTLRKQLSYPPYLELINITIYGPSLKKVEEKSEILSGKLSASLKNCARVLGPAPAPISKLRGNYRWHVLLKIRDFEPAHAILKETLDDLRKAFMGSGVKVSVDVDPFSMM